MGFSVVRPRSRRCLKLATLAVAVTVGCGGGGNSGGGGGGGGNTPDFTLSISPASLTITGGGTASATVTATGLNGFNSAIALTVSGLPSGITLSPTSLSVTPGTPEKITFSASSTVSNGAASVRIVGTVGSTSHTSTLAMSVQAGGIAPALSRTGYLRTDAVTEYYLAPNQSWIIFDPIRRRFFVTDPFSNQVMVIDSVTRSRIANIAVPGAYGIDETSDHSTIYAGTQVGDVYAIDPVSMQVTKRYRASQIGPYGFAAFVVRVLANGKLALLGGQGGWPGVDGFSTFAIWNPADNSLQQYGGDPLATTPALPNCVGNIGVFTLTGDRSLIVEGSIDSDSTLCTVNPDTGAKTVIQAGGILLSTTATRDGKSLLMVDYVNGPAIRVFDAHTLTQTAMFTVAGDTSSAASLTTSPDSKTVYMWSPSFIYAYDIASGQQVGWTPSPVVESTSGGLAIAPYSGPNMQAWDDTGMIAGPMEEGVGFVDSTALRTGAVGTPFLNGYFSPPTGPSAGGTVTQWPGSASGTLAAVYFGKNKATNLLQSTSGFSALTPAGSPGPVDVYSVMADGGVQIVPDGFSYGPTILEVAPNYSPAEGGGTGIVYGYGLGQLNSNAIPADLQVTVGGRMVPITGYDPNSYGLLSPPFLLQAFAFTIPPGSAGTSADLTVTTPSGSATVSGAVHYLPATQTFSLNGASLAQGIYDSKRDLYYFTDAAEIRVFSRTLGSWLNSIAIPATPASPAHRLWGIALSSDGSKLTVSDTGAASVYLIDPDNPTSLKSFPLNLDGSGFPAGLAISNSGIIYLAAAVTGGTGFSGYYRLDTNTGNLTNLHITGPGNGVNDAMLRTQISSDNTRVFFNNVGATFSIDTSSGTVRWAIQSYGCCYGDYDLAMASNQTQMEASEYLYDTDLNAESFLTLNDREIIYTSYVYGAKLSPDASLLFQPSINGMDVFDGRRGVLAERIALPFALSRNFDALVNNGRDNVLIAITGSAGTGISVLDLTSLSEPVHPTYEIAEPGRGFWSFFSQVSSRRPMRANENASRSGTASRVPMSRVQHATNF